MVKAKWAVVRLGSFFLVCEEEEENNWPKITRHSQWEGSRNAADVAQSIDREPFLRLAVVSLAARTALTAWRRTVQLSQKAVKWVQYSGLAVNLQTLRASLCCSRWFHCVAWTSWGLTM